ncbi:hypothetical protein HDU92_000331, partial [Lobulomyces angularis]
RFFFCAYDSTCSGIFGRIVAFSNTRIEDGTVYQTISFAINQYFEKALKDLEIQYQTSQRPIVLRGNFDQ